MKLPLYYLRVNRCYNPDVMYELVMVNRDGNAIASFYNEGNEVPYYTKQEALEAARDLMKIFEPGLVELKEE